MRHNLYSMLLPFVLFAAFAAARSMNRTIDDEYGDNVTGLLPAYYPLGLWAQGRGCPHCNAQPDWDRVFGGTWHDITYHPGKLNHVSITARFNGTAVYVYNTLPNTIPYTTTSTNLTFSLEGTIVGTYEHVPNSTTEYEYNKLVYMNEALDNNEHVLVIQSGPGTSPSLVLFDYIIYTFVEDEEVGSLPSSTTVAPQISSQLGTPSWASPIYTAASSSIPYSTTALPISSLTSSLFNNSLPSPGLTSPSSTTGVDPSCSPNTLKSNHSQIPAACSAPHQIAPSVTGIVGSTFGAIFVVTSSIVALYFYSRRRKNRQRQRQLRTGRRALSRVYTWFSTSASARFQLAQNAHPVPLFSPIPGVPSPSLVPQRGSVQTASEASPAELSPSPMVDNAALHAKLLSAFRGKVRRPAPESVCIS